MSSTIGSTPGLAIVKRPVFRVMAWIACAATLALYPAVSAQVQPISVPNSVSGTVIVVGFVGGFVRNDDDRRPEVRIVQHLSEQDIYGLHAVAFENRRWGKARKEVLHWLDANGDGHLSPDEKQNARIILFGNGWGGSAAIKLARDLDRQGIPVLMTIEVDSINKFSGNDCLIPPNVGRALNFYQPRGLIHGCRLIRTAESNHTRILGNYRFEYSSQPVGCRSYSWFSRHFFKTHEAMNCDPRVWAQVDDQIEAIVLSSFPPPVSLGEAELATADIHQ